MSTDQLQHLDELLRSSPVVDHDVTIEERRAGFVAMMTSRPLHEGVTLSAASLGGRPSLTVTPHERDDSAVLLYLHGGGYALGSPESGSRLAAQLAARSRYVAHVPDYRLAPEHPFPAAVDDAVSAYRELLETYPRVVVAGDSAGGGLSLALALAARDLGLPQPAAIVGFSPWTDLEMTGTSTVTREHLDPIFDRADLLATASLYAPGELARDPLASPLRADLTGFAPLLLTAGGNEVLLDDTVRLAVRAAEADVETRLEVLPGAPHVFQSNAAVLDEADAALDRAAAFLREHVLV